MKAIEAENEELRDVLPVGAATQGGNDVPFTDGQTIGSMKSFVAKDVGAAMDGLTIKIKDTKTAIDKMWLLERYVLI
jgi:hypothetical protein